jgi:hypothetical protein
MKKKRPCLPAFDYWFTTAEWGSDRRTGTFAVLVERQRQHGDRPGKEKTVWDWSVCWSSDGVRLASGVAQNQKGARRAVREFVRTLSDVAGYKR